MPFPLSLQPIEALTEIISGGPGMGGASPSIGLYRSRAQIGRFMRACNVDFHVNGSHVLSLEDCFRALNAAAAEDAAALLPAMPHHTFSPAAC